MFSGPVIRHVSSAGGHFPLQVVDLGCGECSLLRRLKFHRDIELLVGVDLDRAKAMENKYVSINN